MAQQALTKHCTKCRVVQPFGNFHRSPSGKFGLRPVCKPCAKEYNHNHYIKNKVAYRKKCDEWQAANPGRREAIRRRHQTGWEPEEFEAAWQKQRGLCGICRSQMTRKGGAGSTVASADHCHDSGKKRGILCARCNSGIGFFKHDIEILKQAISYLEAFK